MKRFTVLTILTALVALWTMAVWAAVPQLINFQGILRDGGGNPVGDGSYSVVFTIYDAPVGGANLWTETQSVSTASGLFSALLGSTNPLPDLVFNNPNRWLGIKVGADAEMTPRPQLVSVGYAQRVGTVDGATGGVISGDVSIQSNLSVDGAMNAKNMVLVQPGPNQTPLSIQGSSGQTANLVEIKDDLGATLGSVDSKGALFSRFALFAHTTHCQESLKVDGDVTVAGSFKTSGLAEITGNDLLVTTGSVAIQTAPLPDVALRAQSGATLHELGHNLSVRHTAPGSADDFFQAWDNLGNKVASIDASGNMTLDGDMDGLNCTWENGQFIDINCNGTFNAGGDVSVGGNVSIGTAIANSRLQVGGALATAFTVVSSPTSSITLDASHSIVLCNAVLSPITVNLPPAATAGGRQYTIKLIFSNFGSVIIDPFGGETIEDLPTYSFSTQYQYVTIVSDGTEWWIVANN